MQTTYEMLAREKKALAIVRVLEEHGVTSKDCEGGAQEGRLMAAEAAGVKPPSDETWGMVVQMLRSREKGTA